MYTQTIVPASAAFFWTCWKLSRRFEHILWPGHSIYVCVHVSVLEACFIFKQAPITAYLWVPEAEVVTPKTEAGQSLLIRPCCVGKSEQIHAMNACNANLQPHLKAFLFISLFLSNTWMRNWLCLKKQKKTAIQIYPITQLDHYTAAVRALSRIQPENIVCYSFQYHFV